MSNLIDRQAAIDALGKHEESQGHNYSMFRSVVSECAEIIWDLPSAEPKQKTGIWMGSICSACGISSPNWFDFEYCPHCGARMQFDASKEQL